MDRVLGPRAARVNRRLEVPVLVSALTVLPMFFIELVATDGWLPTAAVVINWLIWTAFAIEFILLFSLTDDRPAYLRKAWLHLSVIPFAYPLLLEIASGAAWEGAFRILRFIVLVAVLVHSCAMLYLIIKHLFFDILAVAQHPWVFLLGPLRRRGLGVVVMLLCGLAVGAGLLHSLFEERHPVEGMWWALVTLTTVGYGDITPVTVAGRITAAALMVSGIGVLSLTTAKVAAFFVEGDYKSELHEEVRAITRRLDQTNQRLDRIEELLSSRNSPETTTASED